MYSNFDYVRRIVPATSTAFITPTPPAFPLSGSSVDLWFSNNLYYDSGIVADPTGVLSISRASDGYAKNSSGVWVPFTSNVFRITDLGLLTEGSRENFLLNSGSPATQTTGSLSTGSYTLWVEGSGSALASAGTATISGEAPATQGSPNTFSVTVAGTVVITVTGSLTLFQLENGGYQGSYILTTGSTATRATDLITTIGNLDSIISGVNPTCTIVIDLTYSVPAGTEGLTWILSYVSTNDIYFYESSNDVQLLCFSGTGGAIANNFGGTGMTFSTGVKIGVSNNASGRSLTAGGNAVSSDAGQVTPAANTLGSRGGSQSCFATIRRMTVWNSRLSDATLQALTAP